MQSKFGGRFDCDGVNFLESNKPNLKLRKVIPSIQIIVIALW